MNWLLFLRKCQHGCQTRLMLLRLKPGMAPWPAAMVVWGPGFTSTQHRHHCVQLVLALRGTLRVRNRPEEAWKKCGAALVRPDATHEVDARGGNVLIAFIDAESEVGAALTERIDGNVACVPAAEVDRWRGVLGSTPNEDRTERWLRRCVLGRKRALAIHPGVGRVLSYLRSPESAWDDLSLTTLAGIAGLSRSRFMHAFTESVGVPVRPYILWLRLQRAACDLMAGASVTSAAHHAMFSDAAHLTRTFRRMLGTTPSDLALRKKLSRGVSLES